MTAAEDEFKSPLSPFFKGGYQEAMLCEKQIFEL